MRKQKLFLLGLGVFINTSHIYTADFISSLSNPVMWNQNKASLTNDLTNKFINLASLNFNGMTIQGIDFSGMPLSGINLSGGTFNNCSFLGTQLFNANLTGCTFNGGTFQDAHVQGANFASVVFNKVTNLRMQIVEGIDSTNYGIWFDVPNANRSAIDVIKQHKGFADQAKKYFDQMNFNTSTLNGLKAQGLTQLYSPGSNNQLNQNQQNQYLQVATKFYNYYQLAANMLSDLIACMNFNLSNQGLSGQDFSNACFRNVNLSNANCIYTEFKNADFRGANITYMMTKSYKVDPDGGKFDFQSGYRPQDYYSYNYFFLQNVRISDSTYLPNQNLDLNGIYSFIRNCTDPIVKSMFSNFVYGNNNSQYAQG